LAIEFPTSRPPGFAELAAAFNRLSIAGGTVAALFATTGPLVLILAVAQAGNLDRVETTAWIFAGYGFGGVFSILFSWLYRLPLGIAWSIPGTAMLLASIGHLSFSEVIGAYLVCGVLIALIGTSGWVGWVMDRLPVAVVMGMVAGVFLPIGLKVVTGFAISPPLAAITVTGFLVVSIVPALKRVIPPVLGALIAGTIGVTVLGAAPDIVIPDEWTATPVVFAPSFTVRGLTELVVPLLVSVIAIQNLQGFTVLREAGHKVPGNALTVICGYGTLIMGMFGSVPTVVTGPANAMMIAAGAKPEHRYAAGMTFGILIGLFGLFAPVTTAVAMALPAAFIAVLGGLAIFPILGQSFQSAFSGSTPVGALTSFMVTVSGITLFNIGAAFWGLVFGYAVAWLLRETRRG
jgi:benzoate membrane transport protein